MRNTADHKESVDLWKMSNVESIEQFYKRKFNWLPGNIRNEIGHFNVFRLEPFSGEYSSPVPYKRRDFFKITFVKGNSLVHYADKTAEVKKQALTFSNPQIPYKWEHQAGMHEGYFCIFNQHFFHQFGNINQYRVFQPGGKHIFELTREQMTQVVFIFERMLAEIGSGYTHKFDVLRTLVHELIHFALKLEPGILDVPQQGNASGRIATLFLELLERQFPIEENHPAVSLRTASDFAVKLNIHVNHLNRAMKEITGKTTSQIIADRILQEAKILLRHSPWNAGEIAYALGFSETTHFSNFFKKHTTLSPLKFRKAVSL